MRCLIVVTLALAAVMPVAAQQPRPERLAPGDSATASVSPARQRLERQLRQRMAQVVRTQLQLTDDQFRQLADVNRRYEARRQSLLQEERALRLELRAEVVRGAEADQQHVSTLLDQWMSVQEQRLELIRAEQRDLAKFLTPVQRAKYVALQEQLRTRINEIRRRQLDQRREGAADRRPLRRPGRRTPLDRPFR